jgi:site-specific DNA-cytosine methylase
MKVLVACEYSGAVRDSFLKRGHDAWSCDLLPSESVRRDRHFQTDVTNILNFGWDLMIAHPPCTHLAVSGARWFKDKKEEQEKALAFVKTLLEAPIERICVENPISIISSRIRKPTQIIQPYMFGDPFTKTTCLWLKNLEPLKPTNMVEKGERHITKSGKSLPTWYNLPPSEDRWKLRSRTFQGIADAMAEQWGNI